MYTAQNRFGLDDQKLWNPGDTHQTVASRVLAAHGGSLDPTQRADVQRIAAGGAYQAPNASPSPTGPAQPQGPQNLNQALTGQSTVGQQPQAGQQTNVAAAYQSALVNKLTGGGAPIDAQNPAIKGSIDANRLAEQRGMERNRALLAERAAAGGYNDSGAFDSQLLGLGQDRAAREGAFEGAALRDLERQQASEILAAIQLAQGGLGQLSAQDLQRFGIDTDAQLRREGLGVQANLGGRDIDLRRDLGMGNLNLGLLGLLSQNDQFGKQLSANTGMFNATQDANWMRWLFPNGLG